MPIWDLSPADKKGKVISLDAETREKAIDKAKVIALQQDGKRYDKWICTKVGHSDIEDMKTDISEDINENTERDKKKQQKPEKKGKRKRKKKEDKGITILEL